MIKVIPHHVVNDFDLPYRTEDVKFSPSGRRLAVAATDGCIILYAVDIHASPIQLVPEVELRSPALLVPHGVDFLSEDVMVVANRNGNLAFFRVPPPEQWQSPCMIEPLLEVKSTLFGATGVTRKLRERDLFCGPGSVRLFDGVLYVCCNYKNTVSTFACQLENGEIKVEEGIVIAHDTLEVVDGIAISADGMLMALSDHDHHRVAVYRRVDYSSRLQPRFEPVCSLRDIDMHYAHGLRFSPDGKILYVADAGGRYIQVFASSDDWQSDFSASTYKTLGVDEEAFIKSQEVVPEEHRMLEGGAKGLDIAPDGKTIAVTCRNQILRFLETCPLEQVTTLPTMQMQGAEQIQASPALPSQINGQEAEIALSCLVDDTPAIWDSVIPWLASATLLAGVKPEHIHIHHVCALRPDLAQLCRNLGVQTHAVAPFDSSNPYTNKIMQGATPFGAVQSVILTDVDTVFTDAPPFSHMRGMVAGKPVDLPNPPLPILQKVFTAAKVDILGVCSNWYFENGVGTAFETLIGNFNGGVYIIPANFVPTLAGRWTHWTRWLLENIGLMAHWGKHADQVGFCLAVSEMRLPLRILDNRWNYPGHIEQPRTQCTPWVLHHHARFDAHGQLLPVASPVVQHLVSRVNNTIRLFRQTHGV